MYSFEWPCKNSSTYQASLQPVLHSKSLLVPQCDHKDREEVVAATDSDPVVREKITVPIFNSVQYGGFCYTFEATQSVLEFIRMQEIVLNLWKPLPLRSVSLLHDKVHHQSTHSKKRFFLSTHCHRWCWHVDIDYDYDIYSKLYMVGGGHMQKKRGSIGSNLVWKRDQIGSKGVKNKCHWNKSSLPPLSTAVTPYPQFMSSFNMTNIRLNLENILII